MKKKILIIIVSVLCLVLALTLAGCGKKKQDHEASNVVRIYCFGDYIDPDLMKDFQKETGIKVILDTFDTNEEMYPIIKNGTVDYDVICVSDYMIEKLRQEKLLAPLNYDNIPNVENMMPRYLKMAEAFDPGNKYALPHTVGTMGILYNTKKITEGSIDSWNDMWDKKYKGQIVMPDSMRDTFAIALKAKGYSLNATSKEALKTASDYLIKQKPLVYKYANDSARDTMVGGSADMAVIWSGEVQYCQELNEDLAYVIPKEGSEEFLDMWAVPANAVNKTNGEKWINFMLSKEAAEKNYEYLTYAIPNKYVYDMVKDDPEVLNILFPDDKILEKCETLKTLTTEEEDRYSYYWKIFKAD